jgi:opacity protein-like surface antigen
LGWRHQNGEKPMTRFKLLTATAALAAMIASPVMAQQMAPDQPANHRVHRGYDQRDYDRRDSGFWPGQVAAGVVGGAIGAADAISTAPFRDSNAYYNGGYDNGGYNNGYHGGYGNLDPNYAVRNGFVCQPGTWIRGEDGRRHICQ